MSLALDHGQEIRVLSGEWVTLSCVIPGDLWDVWETALERLRVQEGIDHPIERVRNGLVLEVLIANYLAGP